jgi:hypothetical protein
VGWEGGIISSLRSRVMPHKWAVVCGMLRIRGLGGGGGCWTAVHVYMHVTVTVTMQVPCGLQ